MKEIKDSATADASLSQDIDRLISEINSAHCYFPGIEQVPAFRDVLAEYLQGHIPAAFEIPASFGSLSTHEEVLTIASNFIMHLYELRTRVQAHHAGVEFGVAWDRRWTQVKDNWEEKRTRLIHLLNEAADLFESGQCESGLSPSLAKYKLRDQSDGQGDVDSVYWCGEENLRRWAESVKLTPVETVFPRAHHYPRGWRIEQFGRRGRASDPNSAMRAMVIRAIADYVPDEMININGYSTISDLATFIGLQGTTRQSVRGILLGGHT